MLTKTQIQGYVDAGFSLTEISEMAATAQPDAASAPASEPASAEAITAAAVSGAAPSHTHGVDDFVVLTMDDVSVKAADKGPCITLYMSVQGDATHPPVYGTLSFSKTIIDPELAGKSRWKGQTMTQKSKDICEFYGLDRNGGAKGLRASLQQPVMDAEGNVIGHEAKTVRATLRYEAPTDKLRGGWSVASFSCGGGINEDAMAEIAD
tara:strand:+ start:238 stop:861 length:624 start_codon:yes stop_codon:yes gene_type:complete